MNIQNKNKSYNFYVDPADITKYDCNDSELECRILFWIFAAGHNAKSTANGLERFLIAAKKRLGKRSKPFEMIKKTSRILPSMLKAAGLGCFNKKAGYILTLAESNINLKTCSVDQLETFKGIGFKTSRAFVLHSRPNQRLGVLDTHALKYLCERGYDCPRSTPSNKKQYLYWESVLLGEMDKDGFTNAADFDLREIWLPRRVG